MNTDELPPEELQRLVDNNKELDGTKAKITALKRRVSDDLFSITVMMVNDENEKSNGTKCIFQPTLEISKI